MSDNYNDTVWNEKILPPPPYNFTQLPIADKNPENQATPPTPTRPTSYLQGAYTNWTEADVALQTKMDRNVRIFCLFSWVPFALFVLIYTWPPMENVLLVDDFYDCKDGNGNALLFMEIFNGSDVSHDAAYSICATYDALVSEIYTHYTCQLTNTNCAALGF